MILLTSVSSSSGQRMNLCHLVNTLLTEWSGKASGCFIYPFIMYLLNIRTLGGQQINNQIKLNFFFIFDLFSYKLSLSTKEIHKFYFFVTLPTVYRETFVPILFLTFLSRCQRANVRLGEFQCSNYISI